MSDVEHDTYRKDGAVGALVRQLEQLQLRVDRMRKQIAGKASVDDLDRLGQTVAQLRDLIVKQNGPAEPVPSWLGLGQRPDDAKALLSQLVTWLDRIYLRYVDAARSLPECWLWHPEVVEELAWLMGAWYEAYGDEGTARTAGDWNDRLRPGVVRRIRESYAPSCSLENHLPDNATPPRTVPFAETADQIVTWWTTDRDQPGPTPTDEQLAEAAEAARRTRRGGNQS